MSLRLDGRTVPVTGAPRGLDIAFISGNPPAVNGAGSSNFKVALARTALRLHP